VSYAELASGHLTVGERQLRCAPAHSPRLAAEISAELVTRLEQNRFPLRLPPLPLSTHGGLQPLDP
jgi:L-aspartate semialdehyde sulfurtransferase